jgi:hypothetical protein
MAGGGMSHPPSGSRVNVARVRLTWVSEQAGLPVAAAEVGTVVRPGRVRNRTKTEPDEKVKKPADGVRKKSPPARKAPARGRYVDEYARPAC